MLALSGCNGLISTFRSSGTITEGTTSTAVRLLRCQVVPHPMLVRLDGRALHPTDSAAASCSSRASQTSSGMAISTR